MKYEALLDEKTFEVSLDPKGSSYQVGDKSGSYEFTEENGRYFLRMGSKQYRIDNVSYDGSDIEFSIDGNWFTVTVKDEQELLLDRLGFKSGASAGLGSLKSPMPGKILDIMVGVGDVVTKDQPVVILEAMKMENELKSPIDGVVESIHAAVGDSLEKNAPIMEIVAGG